MAAPRLDDIRRAYAGTDPGAAAARTSAVLALFLPLDGTLCLLLERRPMGRSRFSGHLSFPGGHIEAGDASPLAGALREAEEEVGVRPEGVEMIGHVGDNLDPMGRSVSCFIGALAKGARRPHAASPSEVAEVIHVPVAELLRPGSHGEAPEGVYRAQRYEARLVPDHGHVVQYWHLAGAAGQEAVLWGFTAGLTAEILARVWDWQAPAAPSKVSSWDDLRPPGL